MRKKEKKEKPTREKKINEKKVKGRKVRVKKVGIHRKSVVFMWILLIGSVSFGIYKNFTAIDIHTVHEKEVIKEKVVDTNGIESYVKNFAKVYHSWNNNKEALEQRTETLKNYFTEELQQLTAGAIRSDVPTSSSVMDVQIWKVAESSDTKNEYVVEYVVNQLLTEGEQQNSISTDYKVTIHVDEEGNKVIVKNPTAGSMWKKSDYKPKVKETDMDVTTEEREEITEFLETFFKLYPTAGEQELSYYVKGKTLEPIGQEGYVFSKITNPVFSKKDNGIEVSFTVEYLDQVQKITHFFQYDLIVEKKDNWLIVESR